MKKDSKRLRRDCPICSSEEYSVIYQSSINLENDINTTIFSARRLPDRIHGTIVRCSVCKLVRTLEIIDNTSLTNLYSKSLFTYKNLTDNLRRSYGKILLEASFRLKSKNELLEIGCGNGFMFQDIRKIGFCNVRGVEPSRDAIANATPADRKKIARGILKKGIFPDNTFNEICSFQVFDHIPNPDQFLKICFDILRPGGLLVLMNHDVESLSAKILGERSPIYDIEHTYLYSQRTIKLILQKNKFVIQKIYHPSAYFSLRYFLRLLPIPVLIKSAIEKSRSRLFDFNLKVKPGNLCVIAMKSQD